MSFARAEHLRMPIRMPSRIPRGAVSRGGGRAGDEVSAASASPAQPMGARAEPEFDAKPDCLKNFTVMSFQTLWKRIDASYVGFEAPFAVMADFSPPCPCGNLEYRQYIRGHITRDPGGPGESDHGHVLGRLPLGRLNPSFQEDGDIADSSVNYGHRANAGVDRAKLKDNYTNNKGEIDQARGCHYEMSDTPWARLASAPGVAWDIQLDFYGEISNQGRAIQRRYWSPIKGRFTAP